MVGVHCPRACVDFTTPVTTPVSPIDTPFKTAGGVVEDEGVDGGYWAAQLLLIEGWEVHVGGGKSVGSTHGLVDGMCVV